jgi:hypothetical protein
MALQCDLNAMSRSLFIHKHNFDVSNFIALHMIPLRTFGRLGEVLELALNLDHSVSG